MPRSDVSFVWATTLLISFAAGCSQGVTAGAATGEDAEDQAKKRDCTALKAGVASGDASAPALEDLEQRAQKLEALRLDTPELQDLASGLAMYLRQLSKAMSAIDAVSAKQIEESAVRSAAVERFECKKEPDACRAFLGPIIGLAKLSPDELGKMIAQIEKAEFKDPAMVSGAKEVVLSLRALQTSTADLAAANEAVARAGSKLDALSQTFDRLCP